MQQEKDPTIQLPIKPILVWLLAAIGGSMGGAAMMPDKSDVFSTREWVRMEDRMRRAETRTDGLTTLEYRVLQLEKQCAEK
jgi:hypothetical protein